MGLDPQYTGEFETAAKWCEKVLEVHQLGRPALPIEFIEEPGLCSRANFSVVQWALGYLDRARRTAAEAIAGARALGHDWTIVYAMTFASFLRGECADDHEYAELAHKGLALAIDRRMAMFVGIMGLHDHCARARAGADLDKMYAALVTWEDTFGAILVPWFRVMIARAHAGRREYEQGLAACKAALADMETTGAHQFEVDALQVKGRLLSAQSEQNGRAAEDCFGRALEVARDQSAKSYELRAATGLAGLWHGQSRTAEGRDLLAPIYGWFTEGFDTPDLKEAKALLDELA